MKDYLDNRRLRFYDELVRILRKMGVDCSGKRVIDVGCATGHLLLSISREYHPASMTGFDYAESAIKIAKTNVSGANFYCDDICHPVNVHKFDVVFCTEVLEHIIPARKALENLLRMTDSTLILTIPNGRIDTHPRHINFWSPESWSVFLNEVCSGCDIQTGIMSNGTRIFSIIRKTVCSQRGLLPNST